MVAEDVEINGEEQNLEEAERLMATESAEPSQHAE